MSTSPIVYVEIPAPDLEKARAFYTQVFNWQIDDSYLEEHAYLMFRTGDDQIHGGFASNLPPQEEGITLYIQVEDIPQALAKIEAAGGASITEKTDIGDDHGFMATFKDTNGNHIRLWSQT